jgi:hypothetical protein
MKTALLPGEAPIRHGGANLQRGIETVGGHLYLTTQRLVFESHAFNVQTGTTALALDEIGSIELCWTKFLGLIPLVPNSLAVTTVSGTEHRFVLWGRGAWRDAIAAAQRR